jgi:hypothetical protein
VKDERRLCEFARVIFYAIDGAYQNKIDVHPDTSIVDEIYEEIKDDFNSDLTTKKFIISAI